MRIVEISVEGLFGTFDHVIPFKTEERVTIIHGPNGFGKTAILRLIDGFFNSNYSSIRTIPFKKFSIKFDDASILILEKNSKKNGKSGVEISLNKNKSELKSSILKPINEKDLDFPLGIIDDILPNLERIDHSAWLDAYSGEVLGVLEVLDRYGDDLPIRFSHQQSLLLGSNQKKNTEKWLVELTKQISVHFIKTERLQMLVNKDKRLRDSSVSLQSVVSKYSSDIKRRIGEKIREYASLSQSLDSNFPIRLVREKSSSQLTDTKLREQLENIEKKSNELTFAGLLDQNQRSEVPTEFNETNKMALALYAEDTQKKLSVFDDIAEKVEIFKDSVNSRFQYKKMSVDKDSGIKFLTDNNQNLPLESLSSGEQHELVLFYDLLFNVIPDSLVLIDEPEISLHVAWQKQFLKDLQAVTANAQFDVLLATHSPQIIANRWDLTVELKGVNSKEKKSAPIKMI
jgi:predicted ATP-binding protein involved in virulence